MNQHTSFERYVIEAFDREGPGRPVPDAIHDDLLYRAGRKRQWPSWLASIKEPPMRLSNSLAVGSPTVRVVAVLAATLLLALLVAGAGVAGSRLLAADGVIVVDSDGGGSFTTITEAVASAEDGDEILVKPGVYPESVTITQNITLRGEDREVVIIEVAGGCTQDPATEEQVCGPDVPQWEGAGIASGGPYGLRLDDTEANVQDLTFRFLGDGDGLVVSGGAPVIERVAYEGNTYDNPSGLGMVILHGGSAASVKESDFGQGWVMVEESSPVTVEGSTAGAFLASTPLSEAMGEPGVFRGNTTDGVFWINGRAVVEGNEITPLPDITDPAILVEAGSGWIVKDNIIKGASSPTGAIVVDALAGPGEIAGNTLEANEIAISIANDSRVEGNMVTDGTSGILVQSGSPQVVGNTVEGMRGIGITVRVAGPTLSENRGCGSATDLYISQASEAVVDDTNEFCVVSDERTE